MSNVLGIVGSPRKNGNTHILVSKILEGAKQQGATVNSISLGELSINECDGCYACWHGCECSKHDDMNKLYPKINQADILVLGTPVYWYNTSALMKGFIDRLVYYNCEQNRGKIKEKNVVIAIPFEDQTMETVVPVVQFFERSLKYLEMNLFDQVIVEGISKTGEISKRKDVLDRAFLIGQKIVKKE
ncbi:MAG: multimeric flavodoxin WrbA [Firmicutes bacterium]|nr:multimeric flavodoxin WrbA [Bacillota bacterium]